MAAENTVAMLKDVQGNISFRNLRESYIETGLYLGAPDVNLRCRTDWDVNGPEDVLVHRNSLEEGSPVEAELVIVAEISSSDFFMTSDGYYYPRSFEGRDLEFQDERPNCALIRPSVEPWRTDFLYAVTALRLLEQRKSAPGTQHQGLYKDEAKRKLKIIHKLFMKRIDLTESERRQIAAIQEPRLTIEHWPVPAKNRDRLEAIKGTHVVFPIPAYDTNDRLIDPEQYRKKLAGALVECRFSLSHWYIQNKNSDTFNAFLRKMKILQPPRPSPTSETKRKHQIFVDMDGENSPVMKRLRLEG